eukprot:3010768-Amphidinium_carterae.1
MALANSAYSVVLRVATHLLSLANQPSFVGLVTATHVVVREGPFVRALSSTQDWGVTLHAGDMYCSQESCQCFAELAPSCHAGAEVSQSQVPQGPCGKLVRNVLGQHPERLGASRPQVLA